MKNLTTRKIVLGLLMTLVLAFGVQGIADAITKFTRGRGDLQLYAPNQDFTITFSVGLQGRVVNTPADPATNTPATYHYDDESITIASSGANIRKIGNTDITPGTSHAMNEKGTGAARLSSSVSVTLRAANAGTVSITITDTSSGNRPSTDTGATALVFVVYIAPTQNDSSEIVITGTDITDGQDFETGRVQIDNDFTALTDVRVTYAVSGSGRLYASDTTSGHNNEISVRSPYTTSSATTATVNLDMNGSTNTVTISVAGQRADLAKSVTYIYSHATLTEQSGDKQRGSFSSRLAEPLVVKVVDGKNKAVSGVEVDFEAASDNGSFIKDPNIPSDSNRYPDSTDFSKIKTDSSGQAHTFWVLNAPTGDPPTNKSQTATAQVTGASAIQANVITFTATAGTSTASSIVIEDGDGQRANKYNLIEDPLVVTVRDERGQLFINGNVEFLARDGGTLHAPEGTDPGNEAVGGTTDTVPYYLAGYTTSDSRKVIVTNSSGQASIRYTPPQGGERRTVSATILNTAQSVIFTVNGTPSSGGTRDDTGTDRTTTTNSITISPSSITGGPGDTETISVSSSPAGTLVTLSSNDFENTNFSPQSGLTPFTSTLTLPSSTGSYSFFAVGSIAGATVSDSATVTVGSAGLGTLTISPSGAAVNGVQNVTITARDADGGVPADAFTVTLSGTGFATTTATVQGGSVIAPVRLPTTAATYVLTARATGYEDATTRLVVGGQQPVTGGQPTPTGSVGAAASLEIDGQRLRSGIVNEPLDAPLRVRVTDANGRGVSGVRVTFRVLSPARGTFAGARGRGNAVLGETDRNGYASANFTPTSSGDVVVRASAADVSPVTFILDINGGPEGETDTRTPGPGVTPSREISPVVHVGAANRPPMLWVDGGKIYALVGTDVQEFASGVEGAMNVAIGGRKVYWTEQTGQSSGTINSANLDGTGVTELTSIMAVPMGIAVDGAGSKLYWTNSRGRIQRANLDGSKIQNVLQNLPSPMDIALLGGNAYWTQGGNVRVVNLSGTKRIRNISTGADAAMSLAISGGKVYWTEQTGQSAGTINRANLDGSAVTQLTSIKAVPMGIAVDGSRRKIFWTNSRGRAQSANLDGSKIQNVVDGLGMPGDMLLSNSLSQTTAGTSTPTQPTQTADNSKYDVNGDGKVDNADVSLVAGALNTTNARYDVNGDNVVNASDIILISNNLDPGAAAAPMLLGMKLTATQIDNIKEQIDLLIATGDRSPAVMRTLIYLQQLIATARPEKTQLLANYPNPFNPETWIPYELATDTNVRITIYNTQGVVIRTLALGHQSAGYYTGRDRAAYWDGRNALGEQVASGIYFYQFETDDMSSMRKMVILK